MSIHVVNAQGLVLWLRAMFLAKARNSRRRVLYRGGTHVSTAVYRTVNLRKMVKFLERLVFMYLHIGTT